MWGMWIIALPHSQYPHGRKVILNWKGVVPVLTNGLYGVWFSLVTMCGVGYGDIVPVYIIQYLIAIALMILGSFLFAIPVSIIIRHFSASYEVIATKERMRQEAYMTLSNGNKSGRLSLNLSMPLNRRKANVKSMVFPDEPEKDSSEELSSVRLNKQSMRNSIRLERIAEKIMEEKPKSKVQYTPISISADYAVCIHSVIYELFYCVPYNASCWSAAKQFISSEHTTSVSSDDEWY